MPVNRIDTDAQIIGNFLTLQTIVNQPQYSNFTRRKNIHIIISRQYAALTGACIDDFWRVLIVLA